MATTSHATNGGAGADVVGEKQVRTWSRLADLPLVCGEGNTVTDGAHFVFSCDISFLVQRCLMSL